MLFVAAIVLATAAPARAETILGVVTSAVTHAGLVGYEVCAYPALPTQAEGEAAKQCTQPEPDPETPGEYNLGNVVTGFYKVAFLPNAESKYAAEFYDDARTWEEAEVIHVPTGFSVDAALAEAAGPGPPSENHDESSTPPPVGSAPPATPPLVAKPMSKPKPRRLRCRKGFKKKKVKGKYRCVRVHPPKRRAARASS